MSKSKIDELGLNVIPLNTIADGVEYHDTVDIDAEKLCELMRKGAKISTSTPTIGEIEEYFDRLFEESKADVIIHFTISSKLSSMFSLFTTVCIIFSPFSFFETNTLNSSPQVTVCNSCTTYELSIGVLSSDSSYANIIDTPAIHKCPNDNTANTRI
jgi:hypothetical protein